VQLRFVAWGSLLAPEAAPRRRRPSSGSREGPSERRESLALARHLRRSRAGRNGARGPFNGGLGAAGRGPQGWGIKREERGRPGRYPPLSQRSGLSRSPQAPVPPTPCPRPGAAPLSRGPQRGGGGGGGGSGW